MSLIYWLGSIDLLGINILFIASIHPMQLPSVGDANDSINVTVPGLEHPMGFSHLKCSDLEDCGIYYAKKSLQ